MSSAMVKASAIDLAYPARGTCSPAASITSLNRPLSSAASMASRPAPINSAPYFSKTPRRASSAVTFRAV